MAETSPETPLKKTPLNALERELGGKMVDFGGWDLPVQFSGILEEHQAVRTRAGLFDVSHMGEVFVRGRQATELLQKLTCNDVSKLEDGRCQYNGLLYPTGGFVDDILIYRNAPDDYLIVVNAANAEKDYEWIADSAKGLEVFVENRSADFAQLALQGPEAEGILQPLTDLDPASIRYYRFARGRVDGVEAIVSRTGYTGEDGFEIYVAPEEAPRLFRRLLEAGSEAGLLPCGLGARDTLRLEAKMALYGNDIDHTTTPLEADLGSIVKLDKGEFFGRDVLVREKAEGVARKLVGFEMVDRGIARHGYPAVDGSEEIGVVTSGTHSPTLGRPIGLAYLPPDRSEPGSEFTILIRGRETRARVVPTPFYKRARH
ncbi:MAG TPA: glycine cleavage system aminomethyltransferase GcvT [Thermoanaerobaculia bacterium]|nr:glycine cleavage system aminomethyltransferase GcvT [Thermoanaerobaculia bacterium]